MWSLMLIRTSYIQVLYLGRAPRTKETLHDFREKCQVTRHSRVFRGFTGSQRTPGIEASHICGQGIFVVSPSNAARRPTFSRVFHRQGSCLIAKF